MNIDRELLKKIAFVGAMIGVAVGSWFGVTKLRTFLAGAPDTDKVPNIKVDYEKPEVKTKIKSGPKSVKIQVEDDDE